MLLAETVTDRATARLRDRWKARRVLWAESSLERVRKCGRVAVGPQGAVVLRASTTDGFGSAGYAGVATCGSAWACPVCSAKIARERAGEIARAIRAWHQQGGEVVMITLTELHNRRQRLDYLWSNLSYAWDAATSSRAGRADREAFGVVGSVRVVEVTVGPNGWHVHVHALLFVEPWATSVPRAGLIGIGGPMFLRWADALARRGMRSPRAADGGLDVRLVDLGADAKIGAYLAKNTYDLADPEVRAAMELARGDLKDAKAGNRTPFALLRDIVDLGDAADLELWIEYEQASRGKRQRLWSHGMRRLAGLPEVERTDEEIAETDLGGTDVVLLPGGSYADLIAAGLEVKLLEVARIGPQGVRPWLDSHGIAWAEPSADRGPPRRRARCRVRAPGRPSLVGQ